MAEPARQRTTQSPPSARSVFRPSVTPSPIAFESAIIAFVVAWVGSNAVQAIIVALSGRGGADSGVPIWVLAIALPLSWTVLLAAMWTVSERSGTADPISDFGISFSRLDLLGLGIGVVAQLVVVRAIYLPLERLWPRTFTEEALQENAEDLVGRAAGFWTIVLFLLVVFGAPFAEELFYRGLLQRSMLTRVNDVVAVVIVAAVFALVHLRPIEYPGLFAFGLIVGACALLTGRLGMSILAHLAFNATGLILVL